MKQKVNIIYLCIHQRLSENSINGKYITRGNILEMICRLYHIRRKFKHLILKELIEMNLIKPLKEIRRQKNSDMFEVCECPIDLENTSLLCRRIGLY